MRTAAEFEVGGADAEYRWIRLYTNLARARKASCYRLLGLDIGDPGGSLRRPGPIPNKVCYF
jgi:hypothetical protein